MITFGPVPSRRLGRSLGINHVYSKTCSYSCVYCQLGRTNRRKIRRNAFYEPNWIMEQVEKKIAQVKEKNEVIDFLTFVPSGEPSLDIHLGTEIEALKNLGYPIAVITNASLIGRRDVREALLAADLVSLKLDAVRELYWTIINRPHPALNFRSLLTGLLEFAGIFEGELVTETMLINNINHGENHLQRLGEFLSQLQPAKAYLSVPTRPPSEKWVSAPTEEIVNQSFQILGEKYPHIELLIGCEGNSFHSTSNIRTDLLSITSVHPMRREALCKMVEKSDSDWSTVNSLVEQGDLCEVEYRGSSYYVRSFHQ